MFFIGIFGIEDEIKELKIVPNMVCPDCGRLSSAVLVYYYTFFHFFFIPLFKWNKSYVLKMRCCGAEYTCDKEAAEELQRTGEVDFGRMKKRSGPNAGRGECAHCGRTVAPGFVYCPYCGKPL